MTIFLPFPIEYSVVRYTCTSRTCLSAAVLLDLNREEFGIALTTSKRVIEGKLFCFIDIHFINTLCAKKECFSPVT